MGYLRFLHRFLAPAGAVAALACGGDDLVLPTNGTDGSPTSSPTVLQMVTGDGQVGAPGSPLAQPVVVKLLDQDGNPMPDQRVAWVISTGGGTVVPQSPTTDENGTASATWMLGSEGPNSVSAVVSGIDPVIFTAMAENAGGDDSGSGGGGSGTGTVPSAGTSTVSADPSSIEVGVGVATIRVTVRDAAGAPVPGAVVTLTASGTGNTLTQPKEPTGTDGVAVGKLKSSVAGTKDIVAVVDGTLQINQTAQITVSLAPADRVRLVEGNNQRAEPGAEVPVRPAVRVLDTAGNPVAGYEVIFVVGEGGGTVNGAIQTTDADGIARVDSWILGQAGRNTLEARAGSLRGSPVIFTASAVAPPPPPPPPPPPTSAKPDHFVFRVPPHDVNRNEPFQVEVAIVDVNGNVVPLNGIEIYVGIFRQGNEVPSNTLLVGDRFRDTQNGVAVFNLSITDTGTFRMRALSDELPQLGPHGPEPWLYSAFFNVR
jgi:adhesin/invasin